MDYTEPGVRWDNDAGVWRETRGGGQGPNGQGITSAIVEDYIGDLLARLATLEADLAAYRWWVRQGRFTFLKDLILAEIRKAREIEGEGVDG